MLEKQHVHDDELKFADKKPLIKDYCVMLKTMGYEAVKIMAAPDMLYSFRAILRTFKNNREVFIFYSVVFTSELNLSQFRDKYLKGNLKTKREFMEAVEDRITWYTEEEILCALLSDNYDRKISDVYINGKVEIPKDEMFRIFELFDFKGGNLKHRSLVRKKS